MSALAPPLASILVVLSFFHVMGKELTGELIYT